MFVSTKNLRNRLVQKLDIQYNWKDDQQNIHKSATKTSARYHFEYKRSIILPGLDTVRVSLLVQFFFFFARALIAISFCKQSIKSFSQNSDVRGFSHEENTPAWLLITMVLMLCFLAFVFSTSSRLVGHSPQLVYEWTKLDYEWENNDQKNGFVVENNALTGLPFDCCGLNSLTYNSLGIKVWKNRVFVTVPRWRHGVPSTLNEVISNNQNRPILRPYPSWQMQSIEG